MRWGIGDRWISKHIAEAPHRFDVMNSTSGLSKFFLERANKDVNDLELRLVHPAVEVVEDWLHKFKATIGLNDDGPTRGSRIETFELEASMKG